MQAINVAVPGWDDADSYGRIALELAAQFQRLGLHVNEWGWGGRNARLIPAFGGILMGYPTNFHKFNWMTRLGVRVAVTMFESTKLLPGWAEALNECAAVITPSQFMVQVFREGGVTTPVHVVPLGVSEAFTAQVVNRQYLPRPLTVLAIWDRGNRKNGQQAALAFARAFGDDPKYHFIAKCRAKAFPFMDGFSNLNMTLIQQDMTDAELAALYRRCHVMMFPARGEGFGLPPREFAATGGVAIATDWGGTADDLDRWGVPLPAGTEAAWSGHSKGWHGKLGEWAAPDVDGMVDLLKHVASHYGVYADAAVRAAGFVRAKYRWSGFARQVYRIYQEACHASDQQRKDAV